MSAFCQVSTRSSAACAAGPGPRRHFSGSDVLPQHGHQGLQDALRRQPDHQPLQFPLPALAGRAGRGHRRRQHGGHQGQLQVPACTAALQKLIADTFPEEFVTVIDGGHDVADLCLAQRFDKIFYTGSPRVARHVLAEAAKNLTSVALELGGETGNWCVVRKDADLKDAARKIAFFKLLQQRADLHQHQPGRRGRGGRGAVPGRAEGGVRAADRRGPAAQPEYPQADHPRGLRQVRCAGGRAYRTGSSSGGRGDPETLL